MTTLLQQFREYWDTKFSRVEGTILLAVSGGADSMVMAELFWEAGRAIGVAHCNFGLRAIAADLDEQLVQSWCAERKIPFHTVRFDTKKQAAEWKKGTQETARDLRYSWFDTIIKEHGYARVATAHHANDNVETVLINLFKGTGIAGMHGIQPEHGSIIRPLLFATKEMVTDYAAANNITYHEDASNASDDYLRNALRHHIVPAIVQLFPAAVNNVNESIGRIAEAEVLYKKAIAHERRQLLEQRGQDYYIPLLKLRHRQPLATICYELLQPFGFTPGQVPHIIDLMSAETGRFMASATHRIIRNRDFFIITAQQAPAADFVLVEGLPSTVVAGKYIYTFSEATRRESIPQDAAIACLDLDAITFPLILRKWRLGDYMYPLGMNMKKKKVSRLLIDAKVPLHEKEEMRVLECSKRIAWLSAIRLDERYKIRESTTRVLVVKRTRSIT